MVAFGDNLVHGLVPSITWGFWGRGRNCEGGDKGFTNTVMRRLIFSDASISVCDI